jgi:hypothetical protein
MDTTPNYPTTKTGAALFLQHAAWHLYEGVMDYNARKANQGLNILADSLLAEASMAAWFVDLGFDGKCQGDDSSIGGVPCIMSAEA